MEEYTYRAIDKYGKEKRGTVTASSVEAAYEKLHAMEMTPISVEKANIFNKEISIHIGKAVKPRDLSVFCRQIVSMIEAGVTIVDSLAMLEEQTENKVMAKAIGGAKAEIGKGETLANAMAKYPDVFPDIMVKMVSAGEASGKLDIAFKRMASHFEKSARLNAIIKKAAIYPIIVALVAVGVVIVMLTFIVPSYSDMFAQMDMDLPAITKAVVAASEFMIHKWYILLAVVIAAVVLIRYFKQTESGQVFFAKASRNGPIFGKLTIKSAASNFARTLSTLIYSGLPMVDALEITAGTMTNYLYRKKVEEAREEVIQGIPLSEPLLRDNLFPPMVGHMTKIGEETGQIEDMLNRLADYYDEEVEMTTQTVMAVLEPMIILVLAAIVCVLIAAVMAPMLSMYQNLDNI